MSRRRNIVCFLCNIQRDFCNQNKFGEVNSLSYVAVFCEVDILNESLCKCNINLNLLMILGNTIQCVTCIQKTRCLNVFVLNVCNSTFRQEADALCIMSS